MLIYSFLSRILRSGLVSVRPSFLPKNSNFQTQRGFSILEILITTAIIGIITGIVTLRYGSFNNLILLKNQAYEIAIDLRETQARSVSVRGTAEGFRQPYGIYFNSAEPTQYILFLDANPENGAYNTGEELEIRQLDSRFRLGRLCSGSSSSCASIPSLSVTFRRPNFDAIMNAGTVANGVVEVVTIDETSARFVNVNAAGQITVE